MRGKKRMKKFVICGLVLSCLFFAAGCTVEADNRSADNHYSGSDSANNFDVDYQSDGMLGD